MLGIFSGRLRSSEIRCNQYIFCRFVLSLLLTYFILLVFCGISALYAPISPSAIEIPGSRVVSDAPSWAVEHAVVVFFFVVGSFIDANHSKVYIPYCGWQRNKQGLLGIYT